jgi:hypothetical protein
MLRREMERVGDLGPILDCTMADEGMREPFDAGFGSAEGKPFLAWSERRVYFCHEYDGAENVESAPLARGHMTAWEPRHIS